jgi:diguanylate cyclase (GGDEF)-like protein
MFNSTQWPILRFVSILFAGSVVFVGSAIWIGLQVRSHLLMRDAAIFAEAWTQHLAADIPDLASVVAGQTPTPETQRHLQESGKVGGIFRFKIFDERGHLQFVADDGAWGEMHGVTLGAVSETARQVMLRQSSRVEAKRGDGVLSPPIFATAYFPLRIDDAVIGVLEAYIDHTKKAREIDGLLLVAGATTALLTGLAFFLPMLGFFWTARQREETVQRLRHVAQHDPLTDLLNRTAFLSRVDALAARNQRFAIHIIDLDRFKDINDTYGHPVGDGLLCEAARRIVAITDGFAEVARLGGDEFALVQPIRSRADRETEQLARRIVATMAVPFVVDGVEMQIGASIGHALFPGDGDTADRLMKSADLALYAAKKLGRGRAVAFDASIEEERIARHSLETRIRLAAERGEFELHFQPLYATDGKTLRAFEALLRLEDQDGVSIAPSVFIPVAEELRLIDRIGAWVLGEACRVAKLWPSPIAVAVNLSPIQFESGTLIELVERVLAQTRLEPARLELEVTESVLLENSEWVLEQLHGLKALGVSIALDDFGTGYSSLSYLWRFPFDTLKVDGSFMKGIADPSSRSREVLDTIIALGRVLNLHVTAEGVETPEQVQVLRELRCDYVQGYLFGRPIPAMDVAATILRAHFPDPQAEPHPPERRHVA